jgi:hypothetical protein
MGPGQFHWPQQFSNDGPGRYVCPLRRPSANYAAELLCCRRFSRAERGCGEVNGTPSECGPWQDSHGSPTVPRISCGDRVDAISHRCSRDVSVLCRPVGRCDWSGSTSRRAISSSALRLSRLSALPDCWVGVRPRAGVAPGLGSLRRCVSSRNRPLAAIAPGGHRSFP